MKEFMRVNRIEPSNKSARMARLILPRACVAAVLAGAALASSASAATLYTVNTPLSPGGTANWTDGTNWTASGGPANANNYPGGDPTATANNDAALINPTTGGYGNYTINYSGMAAHSVSTITLQAP